MEILLYAVSVLYSPGPVNALGLNAGLRGQGWRSSGFFAGVGLAMLLLFLVFGYAGAALISPRVLPWLAVVGGFYMLYLGYRIATASVLPTTAAPARSLGLAEGVLIQLLNPKALLAVLPIATVMFPAAQVTGPDVAWCSLALGLAASSAPASYALLGALLGRQLGHGRGLQWVNRALALSLVLCAFSLFHDAQLQLSA